MRKQTLFALLIGVVLLVGATASALAQTTLEASGAADYDKRKDARVSMTGDGVIPGISLAAVGGPLATIAEISVTSRELRNMEEAMIAEGCPVTTVNLPTVINLTLEDKVTSSSVTINGAAVVGGVACTKATYHRTIDLNGNMSVQLKGITEADLVANLVEIARVQQLYATARMERFAEYRRCRAAKPQPPAAQPATTPQPPAAQPLPPVADNKKPRDNKPRRCMVKSIGGAILGAIFGNRVAPSNRMWYGTGGGAVAGFFTTKALCEAGVNTWVAIGAGGGSGAAVGGLLHIGNHRRPPGGGGGGTNPPINTRVCNGTGPECVPTTAGNRGRSTNQTNSATGAGWRPAGQTGVASSTPTTVPRTTPRTTPPATGTPAPRRPTGWG